MACWCFILIHSEHQQQHLHDPYADGCEEELCDEQGGAAQGRPRQDVHRARYVRDVDWDECSSSSPPPPPPPSSASLAAIYSVGISIEEYYPQDKNGKVVPLSKKLGEIDGAEITFTKKGSAFCSIYHLAFLYFLFS
jgi:hypothetical protein